MCGSEVKPKPSGLPPSALSLLKQASRVLSKAQANAPQVPSPCISVCQMADDTGWCAGCWRTLDEIAGWGQTSADSKRVVWARIAERIQSRMT